MTKALPEAILQKSLKLEIKYFDSSFFENKDK